jgi:hypothetical protein
MIIIITVADDSTVLAESAQTGLLRLHNAAVVPPSTMSLPNSAAAGCCC